MRRESHRRLIEPFRNRKSRRLLWAFLSSELGDGITAIVIPLAVFAASDSVFALAGTFLGRLLLASVFAAAGGWAADRWDRRRLILASYVVRGLLLCALIFIPSDAPAAYALLGILVGATGSFDNPAAESSLRTVYRHDLQSLAAARKTGKTVSSLVGPALGGVLFGAGGSNLALGVNAATFIVSLVILVPDRQRLSPSKAPTAKSPETVAATSRAPSLSRVPLDARLALFSTLASSFLVGISVVVAVPYLDGLSQAPAGAYGYAMAAYSGGGLIGLWLAGISDWSRVSFKLILITSGVVYGLLVAGSVAFPAWQLLAAAWFLWGIAFGPEDVVGDARVAAVIPDHLLGRLYAWWSIIGKIGSALAFGITMFLNSADAQTTLLLCGLAYAMVVPLVLAAIRKPS